MRSSTPARAGRVFFQPVAAENIGSTQDTALGIDRTEVHCVRCESHLGHVFDDGPVPTSLRYGINSAALTFREDGIKPVREKVILGAGCFWGVESTFAAVKGVTATRVGYSGGSTKNPTYEDVCSHDTGHAEVVEVEYDPAQVSFDQLFGVFWKNHNPTKRGRQGPDVGSQYRSAILITTPAQEAAARSSAAKLDAGGTLRGPVTTQIEFAAPFYAAEEYHQKYHAKHGGFCPTP